MCFFFDTKRLVRETMYVGGRTKTIAKNNSLFWDLKDSRLASGLIEQI
jgi:hypothetical protein